MSVMSELHYEITEYLDNTKYMIDEIAKLVGCPVEMVEGIVEERWNEYME